MKYKFETDKRDFSDFSSGRVLYNAANTTAFPVRLASEIAQRCFDILEKKGVYSPYKIYDPCCGGGFLLTTIGFLHYDKILELIATDYDDYVLETARKNLSLLSKEGLNKRKKEIEEYIKKFGKESHMEALKSIDYLETLIGAKKIEIRCMKRDITDIRDFPIKDVNIIITDIPYGNIVSWEGRNNNPLENLFENCYKALDKKRSVLVIVADKKSKLKHKSFERVQYFKLGKRQIGFFEPL
ncbi:MAG: hypothetical protein GX201_12175 [Clostridiales bacterium]|nr:hypothetical protein [Clostridiales bacterium]